MEIHITGCPFHIITPIGNRMKVERRQLQIIAGSLLGIGLMGSPVAGMVKDGHGNVGYDTAAECDAAVRAGTAVFYKSFTFQKPLLRAGEVSVKSMPLSDLSIPDSVVQGKSFSANNYKTGACDRGAPRQGGRDGVAPELQGKFVPYSPSMLVNVYYDKAGTPVRTSMKQCDNWFDGNFPRPLSAPVAAQKPAAVEPAPAPKPVAPKPVVTASPAPAPVVVAPPPAPVPAPALPGAAAAAAVPAGGISTGVMLGLGAALIAIPILSTRGGDSALVGTTGTTGTR
jgi:hypothetical protein